MPLDESEKCIPTKMCVCDFNITRLPINMAIFKSPQS